MNLQPELEGELVKLRPLANDDYEVLRLAAADPLIFAQHRNGQPRATPEGFRKFFQESMDSGGAMVIIDRETNKIIGSSRFNQLAATDRAVEVGWSFLRRAYWGGKYNKAAKRLMIDYLHQYVPHVFLFIAADNLRSQAAARKIGARLITTFDPSEAIKLEERDGAVTYCIDRDFI